MTVPVGIRGPKDHRVFLSHSSHDTNEVEALRAALESRGIACFLDVLELKVGDRLAAVLKDQVQGARSFVVVLSPTSVSSEWVRREVEWALAAEDLASETGRQYRFLPVVTQGITHGFLDWLGRPAVLSIDANGRSLSEVASEIGQALGVLPVDARPRPAATPLAPIAELTLDFHDLSFEVRRDKERVRGRVRVEYQPPAGARGAAVTHGFESPLGPLELGELRWYVEIWPGWSFGEQRLKRATDVEEALPRWGRALFDASLAEARAPVEDFERATGERRIVVQVPAFADVDDPNLGSDERARRIASNSAAARLLALPWELLRDPRGFLFEGNHPVRVVRRLPRERSHDALEPTRRILRVLLLLARPSDAGWIDPRVSLTPLVTALAPLGDRVELVVPADGSLTALGEALAEAERQARPFHVVHFDGHGVYDRDKGLGQLAFEDDEDCAVGKTERTKRFVDARTIGGLLREHRTPLFVLEACQSAEAGAQVTSSVAAELVAAGIGSVVAMSHAVLVETARRFVGTFYPALARGERIGTAMVQAQAALARDPSRGPPSQPRWEMRDWFVPVLFQEDGGDVRLLPEAGLPQAADVELVQRTARGNTPNAPPHGFVGRDRELLGLSRLLHRHPVVLLRGSGGLGKTALAAECARWLLEVHRVRRLAWTSVEKFGSAEAVLQDLGGQVAPGFVVSRFDSLEKARLEVERALRHRPTLLVVDNFESIALDPDPALVPLLAALTAIGGTRLLLTGREPVSGGLGAVELHLGALDTREGRTLVEQVLRRGAQAPREEPGDPVDASWIDALVEAVGGHPRSLVLLAPVVAVRGTRMTRVQLAPLMADLERRNPGDRENSLLASVRLSLDRLGPKPREQVRALAVFHGAVFAWVLAQVLEVEPTEARALGDTLVELGLAQAMGGYLLPDPALGAAVQEELATEDRERMEARWLEASGKWVAFLSEQQFQDAAIAMAGVKHGLGELLAVVEAAERAVDAGAVSVEAALYVVARVEQLLEFSGHRRALRLAVASRERLGRRLQGWNAAAFTARHLAIDRLLQAGDVSGALTAARELRDRARAAGPEAYAGAAFQIAESNLLLARVFESSGYADDSLRAATEAEEGFRALSAAGAGGGDNAGPAIMAAASLGRRGSALTALGRLAEAAAAYEQAIQEADALGDQRGVAVSRGRLGIVRRLQRRFPEAITAFEQARETFEALGEPDGVATSWHQIGDVYRQVGVVDEAERAYLRSLEIRTRLGHRAGQASTLNELGLLYNDVGRAEESAEHHRRAANLFADVGDPRSEGSARNNLASRLLQLSRPTEARAEAQRALELKSTLGSAAEPWTTWWILSQVEQELGNANGAVTARQRAIDTYSAYRRGGGYAKYPAGQVVAEVIASVASGTLPRDLVAGFGIPDGTPPNLAACLTKLRDILAGARASAVLADLSLDFDCVVELGFLIDALEHNEPPAGDSGDVTATPDTTGED